jgi:hypothetical protein
MLRILFYIIAVSGVFINSGAKKTRYDPCKLFGTVYIEKNPRYAHFKVYEEETEAFADLLIYKEEIDSMPMNKACGVLLIKRNLRISIFIGRRLEA